MVLIYATGGKVWTWTTDSLLTHIKVLLRKCQYKEPDEMLLDTLIAGVNDESVHRKLISKAEELTVDKALDIIRAYESTKSQMKDIMDSTEVACRTEVTWPWYEAESMVVWVGCWTTK